MVEAQRIVEGPIRDGFHYVLDVDIKGFFDNVNHAKLLKQIWTLGIQDKNLICLIGEMLKAPIEDKGERFVPDKGTPQRNTHKLPSA